MNRSIVQRLLAAGVAPALAPAQAAHAWHGKGHDRIVPLAAAALAKRMPAFFRAGLDTVAHCSLDPDLFTRPVGPELLHKAESPEHYFDVEQLGGLKVPPMRYDLIVWCVKKGIHPSKVGLLPYAITEWTQRVTVALAEHRKWPDNPHVRAKCLVYAGILSHYAADLCQPLHTTIHYDGRAKADKSSPRTGIHQKVDALLGKLPADVKVRVDPNDVKPLEKLFAEVVSELMRSHALVDRVYKLEKHLPNLEKPLKPDGPAAAFARERMQAAATFTARLFLTAWRDSARIKLPEWHHRPAGKGSTGDTASAKAHAPAPAASSTQGPAPRTRDKHSGGAIPPGGPGAFSEPSPTGTLRRRFPQ